MGKFSFHNLSVEEAGIYLPKMFDILYYNMTAMAPSDAGYENDQRTWMDYIVPALSQRTVQVLLMFAGEELAGYFQYSHRENTLMVDEVEIRRDYQRSMLFYRLGQYLLTDLPENIRYVESYVNKRNGNSLSIHKKLGMEIIGENRSGSSWHFRGDVAAVAKRFVR